MEAIPKFTKNSELVVIEESVSRDRMQLLNEEQVSEGEKFIELQGGVQYIPETFCTRKRNYEREMDSGLASVQKEDIMVDIDESNLIP